MAKSKRLSDEDILRIVSKEIKDFKRLIRGHEKLLKAMAQL